MKRYVKKLITDFRCGVLTDLAIGHPCADFPSFPVYRTFSIRIALPLTPVLVSKSFRKLIKLLEQPTNKKCQIWKKRLLTPVNKIKIHFGLCV